GHEVLPEIDEDAAYPLWNYAAHDAEVRLQRVSKGDVVYVLEGLDWRSSRKLEDPQQEHVTQFEPGEMKLYFVAPREPEALTLSASTSTGVLHVNVALDDLAMPWPLEVTVADPDGRPI